MILYLFGYVLKMQYFCALKHKWLRGMENQGEIILYQPDKEVKLEVRLENETVWLSIDEMSQLFGRDISVIGKHIRNIFKEGELVKDSVWAKFAYTASDGKVYQVDYYNLDVIISVGYRVKSHRGTQFRQWANKVLKDYLLKGYSVNQRLKSLEEKVDSKLPDKRIPHLPCVRICRTPIV